MAVSVSNELDRICSYLGDGPLGMPTGDLLVILSMKTHPQWACSASSVNWEVLLGSFEESGFSNRKAFMFLH